MSKRIAICVWILIVTLIGFAEELPNGNFVQSQPDLNGTWLLDLGRSNVGKSTSAPGKKDELKIIDHEPEFKIRRLLRVNGQLVEHEFIYYTDGRGETNPATMWLSDRADTKPNDRNSVTRSKTRRSGDKLITRSTIRSLLGGHLVEYDVVDEWKLSADGKTLTETTKFIFQQDPMSRSVYVPSGRPDTKRVYNLVAK